MLLASSSYSSLAQSVEHLTVNQGVTGSSPVGGAIFVIQKSYKTQKAQDLVGLVLFCYHILCFAPFAEYLNSGAAFCPVFQKTGLERQFTGIILISTWLLLGLGVVLVILDVLLMKGVAKNFTYEKLLR